MPFAGEKPGLVPAGVVLLISRANYFTLVDVTGRVSIAGKRGAMDHAIAPICSRIGLFVDDWLRDSTAFLANCREGDLKAANSS